MGFTVFEVKIPDKYLVRRLFEAKYPTLGSGGALNSCKIWGAKDKYPKLSFQSIILGKRSYYYCQNLAYFFVHGRYLKKEDKTHYVISHLCHNKGCVNSDHLINEVNSTNESRKSCKKQGNCTKEHLPLCIF